jgi:Bacterial archaeo-eukaryotic release factor family 10
MSAAFDQAPSSLPDRAALQRLATVRGTAPVLSVCLRTDPRDPANTRAAPAWSAALTNGLGAVAEQLEAGEDRDAKLAFRGLHERLLAEAESLEGADLGRAVAWFVSLDGSLEERYVSRLPVGEHLVRLDARPFVSPLVDLAERGAPAGIVLAGQENVRLLEWSHGWIDEAADYELEIDQTDWRPYRGSAGSARSRPTVTHEEHVAAREEAHRDRFFASAAGAVGERIAAAGWERVLLLAGDGLAPRFHMALPEPARRRIQLDLDVNLLTRSAAEVAQRVEPHLEALHRHRAQALADRLADAGPDAASGPAAVLAALAERRVERLVLDPLHVPAGGPRSEVAETVLDGAAPDYAGERAVEAALASDAAVAVLALEESEALARADGMLAELRW